MPDIHTIQLKHPWSCHSAEHGVCWKRSFNWPAGLTPLETARLTIENLPADAVVELNGQQLGNELDITAVLASYNHLSIYLPEGKLSEETECPHATRLEINEG